MEGERPSDTVISLRWHGLDARDDGNDVIVGKLRIITPEPDKYIIDGNTFDDNSAMLDYVYANSDVSSFQRTLDHHRLGKNTEQLLAFLSEHFGETFDQLRVAGEWCSARSPANQKGVECFDVALDWLEKNHKPQPNTPAPSDNYDVPDMRASMSPEEYYETFERETVKRKLGNMLGKDIGEYDAVFEERMAVYPNDRTGKIVLSPEQEAELKTWIREQAKLTDPRYRPE